MGIREDYIKNEKDFIPKEFGTHCSIATYNEFHINFSFEVSKFFGVKLTRPIGVRGPPVEK